MGIIAVYFLVSIHFVLGVVELGTGNNSGYIDSIYAPSQAIRGWINISLDNEASDSLLSAFNTNITIINFLKNNLENKYNCTPSDCSDNYDISNPENTKSFSLNAGESKIIGFKIIGNLQDPYVEKFSFDFNSNAPESCVEPLRIDLTDDNIIDWIPITGSGNFECWKYWGCYNSSAKLEQRYLSKTDFCERIHVFKAPSYMMGAYINVVGTSHPGVGMIMKMLDSDLTEIPGGSCSIQPITGSYEVSCIANVSLLNDSDIYVCIRATSDDNDYKIDAENQGYTCGFYDIYNHQNLSYNYALFAEGGKYAAIEGFTFDDIVMRNYDNTDKEKIVEYVNDYISNKYNNNCQNGCVIPIRFTAGEDQQITISNLILKYNTDSGPSDSNTIYDTVKNSAKLNSGYLKLDLGKANLSVPADIGDYTATINLGDTEILRKSIQIKAIPVIKDIMPLNPPAGVPVSFSVIISNAEGNMSYVWDFGDNSSQVTTNQNTIKHTYLLIGKYRLTIKAIGKSGEYSKTIEINAVSPKSLINKTISGYENDIKNTETQINQLPAWVASEVEKKINLTDIEDSIKIQKNRYQDGDIEDSKAVQIMENLMSLKVPTNVFVSLNIQPSGFLLKKESIDIDLLSKIGAGKLDGTKDEYYNKIDSWLKDSMNVNVESKIYSVSYRDRDDEVIFSDVKINLNPKQNIKELYFVVNGDPDKIKLNGDFKTKEEINSIEIILDDLSEEKTIEFLYPESIDVLNLPVYISPDFKYLPALISTKECNLNGKCESDLGENTQNCSDCKKTWFWIAFFWMIILLFIAFVFYIILQEWYKRHYESSLFKDKNQLFNLINYINNCELHGVLKGEVYKQLRGMQWKDENIDYAWNKLHGLRTGMWEIPIFKKYEHNKVKDELRKRQMTGEKPNPRTVVMNRPVTQIRAQPRLQLRPQPKDLQRSNIKEPTRQGQNKGPAKR